MTSAPFDPHRPFRSANALAAGVTRAALRGPEYRRLFRGCHISSVVPVTGRVLAQAGLTAVPSAYCLSDHSAAELLGLTVPHDENVHLAVPAGQRSTLEGIRLRRCSVPPEIVIVHGIPVTSPLRTFLDLATYLSLVDLVVLGDEMVRKKMVTVAQLVLAADCHRGRDARHARRAAGLVRAGVDSVMESRSRLLLVLAGLPEPVVNFEIRRMDGSVWKRLDMSYPEALLAIEYDGRHHIAREEQWHRDIGRRENLEGLGWKFVILTAKDVYVDPHETLMRTTRAMRQRGISVPQLRPDWRQHFPGRSAA